MLIASDYDGAIATAQRVLRAPVASPSQRAQALHSMGAAYAMQNQHDKCYGAVSEALKITPDDAMIWYNRGMAARFTMRLGRSLRDFERAQELDAGGVLAEKLAFDEAEAALRRALEIDPGYMLARQNLAALPLIRASGKLPEMRISNPLRERPGKQKLSILREGESQFHDLD